MGYFVTVEPDVNLYVEDINPGGDKTIVFLHGWPLSYKQFEYQFNVLPAMGFRCIGIDWRGFGNSDKPMSGYTFNKLTDDIRTVVGSLQINNFTLVVTPPVGLSQFDICLVTTVLGHQSLYLLMRPLQLDLPQKLLITFLKKP